MVTEENKLKKLFFVLGMLLVVTSMMFAQINTVAVVPFDYKGVSSDDAETITEIFTSEYAAASSITVVDRVNFEKIKEQMKFELSDWSNNEKIAQLGKALNANLVLCGQVRTVGNKISLNVRVINVNTTAIVSSSTGYTSELVGLLDEIPIMVEKMTMKPTYKIGDRGPGGGLIFFIEGSRCLEVSPYLGDYNWYDALEVAKNYNGGGFSDWYLPTKGELDLVYENLVKAGILKDDKCYWSSSQTPSNNAWEKRFNDGYQDNLDRDYIYSVRAIRAFNY